MQLKPNAFKRGLASGRPQIGLWCSLCSPIGAEILGDAGFDWLLIDTEHAPNDPFQVMQLLQAIQGAATPAVVRAAWNDAVLIKRLLDVGVTSVLVPFVQNEDEAAKAVKAVRYPPRGVRGVATNARATRFGRIADYAQKADGEMCVLVQAETAEALGRIEAMGKLDGLDGIFIGPADLSASMGHLGNARHPEVLKAIEGAIRRIRKTGKSAGILTPNRDDAKRFIELGANFCAVGSDAGLLVNATDALVKAFKG
ncbi:MAG: HpcH/HpaI aldolase family protein [Rhodospirillales bacterium]